MCKTCDKSNFKLKFKIPIPIKNDSRKWWQFWKRKHVPASEVYELMKKVNIELID